MHTTSAPYPAPRPANQVDAPRAETTYISTYLGNRFWPTEPRIDRIDIEDIAHGLAYQCRFNGQTSAFYSVAQHSIMVASILPPHLHKAALLHDAVEDCGGLPTLAVIRSRFGGRVADIVLACSDSTDEEWKKTVAPSKARFA